MHDPGVNVGNDNSLTLRAKVGPDPVGTDVCDIPRN
jgi:hypothetical protein